MPSNQGGRTMPSEERIRGGHPGLKVVRSRAAAGEPTSSRFERQSPALPRRRAAAIRMMSGPGAAPVILVRETIHRGRMVFLAGQLTAHLEVTSIGDQHGLITGQIISPAI